MSAVVLDRAGRPQRIGWTPPRPPANKGKRYPPNPPSTHEILRAVETLGIACEGCGRFMEFEFPVTFDEPPLCEACEEER